MFLLLFSSDLEVKYWSNPEAFVICFMFFFLCVGEIKTSKAKI